MQINEEKKERFILAGVHRGLKDFLADTTDESIDELEELVKTAGGEVVATLVQNKPDLEAGTYLGEGKLEELAEAVTNMHADAVCFDDELSPVQLRNIADALGVKVLDRSMLILDIFAMRAVSGEGKLQVELAQLKYRLPRLRGMGAALSRTGGGIGTRGPGETQLETDRRHIHRRITALEDDIKEMQKHRELIRSRRRKDGVITVALVGYTNAGKSTLLNTLTDANVLAENKLFATLDPTSRSITLEDNRKVLLVDTVGFIRKLPHHLIEAFKSTLEEAVVADVLLHVIDASSPEMENQKTVVYSTLRDIGAVGKPTIEVLNKWDKVGVQSDQCASSVATRHLPQRGRLQEESFRRVSISAKQKVGIDTLMSTLADVAPGKKQQLDILLPYSEGGLLSELHASQKILSEEFTGDGTKVSLLCDAQTYAKLRQWKIQN